MTSDVGAYSHFNSASREQLSASQAGSLRPTESYHAILRLAGNLQPTILRQTVYELVRRYGQVAMLGANDGSSPTVRDDSSFQFFDLTDRSECDPEQWARQYWDRERSRLPDLSEGCPLRLVLLKIRAAEHWLLLNASHIVTDEGSLEFLIREIAMLYVAFSSGAASLPSVLKRDGAAHADARQERSDKEPEMLRQRLKREFSDVRPLDLSSWGQSEGTNPSVRTHTSKLGTDLSSSVRTFCAANGSDQRYLFSAALLLLLYRYSGQEDVVLWVSETLRSHQDSKCSNAPAPRALALRTTLTKSVTLSELHDRVRSIWLSSEAHLDLPVDAAVDALAEELGPDWDFPLQVKLEFAEPWPPMDAGMVTMELLEVQRPLGRNKLRLRMELYPHEIQAHWDYRADLLDGVAVSRVARCYEAILTSFATNLQRSIAEIPIMAPKDLHQVLVEWNSTEVPNSDMHVHELIAAQACRTPAATAVSFGSRSITYGELHRRASEVACHLGSLGVGPESLVAVFMERCPELVVALLGVLEAGAAYVPLDPSYPRERVAFMVEDCGASVVLTLEAMFPFLPEYRGVVVALDHMVVFRETGQAAESNRVKADNLAYVIYTSGSTGRPKGTMNTHGALLNRLVWMQRNYPLAAGDRVLQKTPMSFDVSVWEFFWPLMVGACLELARPDGHRDPAYLVDVVVDAGVTTIHFVPSMLRAWLDAVESDAGLKRKLTVNCPLRHVICSGEPLTVELQQRFFRLLPDVRLHNLYGPTETAVDVTAWECRRGEARRSVPIGRPVANTRVYVLDKYGHPVPVGIYGELHIGGVQVGRGYLKRPDLTAERFVPDAFGPEPGARLYRTGDLARWLEDGTLEFLGRIDDQVKIRGMRVELGEIEMVLGEHAAVREVAVATHGDPRNQKLVAYVVPSPVVAPVPYAVGALAREGLLPEGSLGELPNGVTVAQLNPRETEFMYKEIFEERCYLRHGIRLQPGDCVFDVGANIGLFSLQASMACPNLSIFAFEPIPRILECLSLNFRLHNMNAVAVPCALSDEVGVHTFTYYPHLSVLSGQHADPEEERRTVGVFLRNVVRDPRATADVLEEWVASSLTGEQVDASSTTLSDFVHQNGIGKIHLLKIDVEKAELEVLDGIRPDDWDMIEQVVVEVHDVDGRVREVARRLERLGYTVVVEQGQALRNTGLYMVYAVRHTRSDADQANAVMPSLTGWRSVARLESDIREMARGRLPEFMLPAHYLFLDTLPLTPSGKLDRRALPQPTTTKLHADAPTAPRTHFEVILQDIWGSVLSLHDIDVKANFFRLGGNSLDAMQIISRVQIAHAIRMSPKDVFDNPTIEGLGRVIEERLRAGRSFAPLPLVPTPRDGDLPLSFSQERIWFVQRLHHGTIAYQFQAVLKIRGRLDANALQRCLTEIVRRNEIYRTTFPTREGQPVQVIHPPWQVALPLRVFTESSYEDRVRAAWICIENECLKIFDPEALPLVRWFLLKLDEDDHILLHTEHHLTHDGWSFNVFLEELFALYQASSRGEQPILDEPKFQFGDFARWQRAWIDSPAASSQLEYWKRKLTGLTVGTELSGDRPRPPVQTFRGALIRFELAAELCERLRRFGRENGATLFMTMLSVFQTLLHRYTGSTDIAIGSGVAARSTTESSRVIGMIINNVVLRTDLTGNPTFREVVSRTRTVCLEAYANQDIPFDTVVQALQPHRTLSHNPLFQIMFNFHDAPLAELLLDNGAVEVQEAIGNGSAKFDLSVTLIPYFERLRRPAQRAPKREIAVLWEFNTDIFETATMQRMIRHFERLLWAITEDPDQRIGAVSMLEEKDLYTLIVEQNRTDRDYPSTARIDELLRAQMQSAPNAVAAVFHDAVITYRELFDKASELRRQLVGLGVGPSVPVGICMLRSIDLLVGIVGILEAGGAYVPLDPCYPNSRIGSIIQDSGIALVLTHASLRSKLPKDVACLLSADGTWEHRAGKRNMPLPTVSAGARDLAYAVYTSGSTGAPKGVSIEHRSVVNVLQAVAREVRFTPHDRLLALTTVSFDIATLELLLPLLAGGTVVIADESTTLDGRKLSEYIAVVGPTVIQATPATWRMLLEAGWEGHPELRILCGGEALPGTLARELLSGGAAVWNMYGPSETTIWSTFHRVRLEDQEEGVVSIGRPIANTKIYILDSWGNIVPPGVPGELHIGGHGLARAYLNRPELTAGRFIPDPFGNESGARLFQTGDVACYRTDGTLQFLGRTDDQVKIRGFRVEPGEIESALRELPEVREAVVVLHDDPIAGKRLVAYLALMTGASLELRGLRDYLADKVPAYMLPVEYILLSDFPVTPNGKVDRRALAHAKGVPLPRTSVAGEPSTALEVLLARLWSEVLGGVTVGTQDDFFELGGHSLLAARVVARIASVLQVQMPLREFFENPTVELLALAASSRAAIKGEDLERVAERVLRLRSEDGGASA